MALIDDDNNQQLQQPSNAIEPSSSQSTTVLTEILVEIFLKKLPVKSLLRCKSVCKLWFSLISEPRFIKSHLNISSHNKRLIFSLGWRSNILNTCCLDHIINNNGLEVVDYPFKTDSREVSVVGSCNGLLCLDISPTSDIDCEYPPAIRFIWNPSTRIYHKLPSGGGHRCNGFQIGFGYDESTDDYKVVSIYFNLKEGISEFETLVRMYSLTNGGWKDIGASPIRYGCGLPVGKFVNGAIHWCISNRLAEFIVSFDLATETFGEVVQPVYDEGKKEVTLGTLGEWLCVVCDYEVRVDLWAMKVYGVQDSWTKLFSVPYTPDPDSYDPLLAPLCISNDGKILFTFGKKLMIYDSNNSSFSDVQNFDEDVEEASTFFESLVSPLPPAAALEHRAAGSNG